jgi:hypothetical protein
MKFPENDFRELFYAANYNRFNYHPHQSFRNQSGCFTAGINSYYRLGEKVGKAWSAGKVFLE